MKWEKVGIKEEKRDGSAYERGTRKEGTRNEGKKVGKRKDVRQKVGIKDGNTRRKKDGGMQN